MSSDDGSEARTKHSAETDDSDHENTMSDNTIPMPDPEKEPEYVGVHSAITHPTCQYTTGETREDVEACGEDATHTVVMFEGKKLRQVAMCDDCGEPEDAADDREWSGDVISKKEIRRRWSR